MASCAVAGGNIKVFCRCLQALSKIGDELLFEPSNDGLSLRAVNADQSTFVCFNFVPDFFVSFSPFDDVPVGDSSSPRDLWFFRIPMKCVAMVFRSHTVERSMERCKIYFEAEEKCIRFVLHCRHDVEKTYNFSILESEKLDAVFAKNECANSGVISSKILLETCNNFQLNTEEICMDVEKTKITVRNYIQSEPERNKVVKTEVILMSEEFDEYHMNREGPISFCMKEFKALLVLAESLNLSLSLYFDRPGRPFTCSIESVPDFTVDCLFATLADSGTDSDDNAPRGISSEELHALPSQFHPSANNLAQQEKLCGSTQPFPSQASSKIGDGTWERRSSSVRKAVVRVPSELQGGETSGECVSQSQGDILAPIEEEEEEELEDPEVLPGTPPPAKKFRSRFLNLSQATLYASQLQSQKKVLVDDSDSDSVDSSLHC